MNGKSGLVVLATDLLIDTDIFIDHIRGARPLAPLRAAYSVVTRCELFAGPEHDEASVQRILAPLREIFIDRATAERAGRLRRTLRLRTPDALIAATALEHGFDLVTRNRRDFERVEGLRLQDPAALARRGR